MRLLELLGFRPKLPKVAPPLTRDQNDKHEVPGDASCHIDNVQAEIDRERAMLTERAAELAIEKKGLSAQKRALQDSYAELESQRERLKDEKRALDDAWLKIRSQQSAPKHVSPLSQNNLFVMLLERAEHGDAELKFLVGLQYLHGAGVQRNAVIGERYLLEAAKAGLTNAQFALGMFHWEGILLDYGLQQAALWMNQAKRAGHPRAAALLSKIESALVDLHREGLERAAQSKASHPPDEPEPIPLLMAKARKTGTFVADTDLVVRKPRTSDGRVGLVSQPIGPRLNRFKNFRRFYDRGYETGIQCLRQAQVRMTRFVGTLEVEPHELSIQHVAYDIADRKGLIHIGSSVGMADMIDSSNPFFDEAREAFTEGVRDAIDNVDMVF